MKEYLLKMKADLAGFSFNEKLLLVSILLLFVPYEFSAGAYALILLYLLFKNELIPAVKKQRGALWLYSFIGLESVVSIFYQNWIGLLNTAGMLLIALYIAFYRKTLSAKLYFYIIQIFLLMSLVCAVIGFIEYIHISRLVGNPVLSFIVEDKPGLRIHAMFYNANFYATMLDFFLIFASCSLIRARSWYGRIYFVICLLVNFFMLLLTGCRAALVPLVFYIPVFLWYSGRVGLFWLSLAAELGAVAVIAFNPDLIPRIEDISTVSSRMKIWRAAIMMFWMHPLFGLGPQTYGYLYPILKVKKAPHAHNIYLDAPLSYGIIGTSLGLGYFLTLAREIWKKRKLPAVRYYLPMVICFVISAAIHGLMDCTLNFWQTGMVFMMILNSAGMIKTPRKTGKKRRKAIQ